MQQELLNSEKYISFSSILITSKPEIHKQKAAALTRCLSTFSTKFALDEFSKLRSRSARKQM